MLRGVKALVTGASSGIGKSCCEVLTREGAKVIGTGRSEDSLLVLKKERQILDFVVADLTKAGECERVVKQAIQMLNENGEEKLTLLVNCAGILRGGSLASPSTNLENFRANFDINVQVPFEMMHFSLPFLKNENLNMAPSIVNVSSVNGKQSFPGCANYCASKAALDQLTRCGSVDLAEFGIRINAVNPGVIRTNLHNRAGVVGPAYDTFLERCINVTHPLAKALGRVGQPDEVAELIAFLASSKAQFITGECVAIDGGRQNLGAR